MPSIKRILMPLIIILAMAATYYLIQPLPILRVECDGNMSAYVIPPAGLRVEYNWTHSVEGTIIVEVYNATQEGLTLVEALSQSFGAGHPYSAKEIGGSYSTSDRYMVYTANYTIGRRLEVEGPRIYANYIRVDHNAPQCVHFQHAVIEVTWEPRLAAMLTGKPK